MASGTIKAVLSRGDVANNLTTSTEGKVLDASQGKILSDHLANIDTTTFTLASGYTANINSVSKNNKIVTIEGEITFASTTSKSFTAIITIPSGYRPTNNFVVSAIDPINDELLAGTLLSSTGNLSFYRPYSTATTQIRFSATYITN